MPQPDFFRWDDAILLLAIQTGDYETPEAIVPGTHALYAEQITGRNMADFQERNVNRVGQLGANPGTLTRKRGQCSFRTPFMGHGTPDGAAGAPIGPLLRAMGFAQTLDAVGPPTGSRYSPVSSGFEAATVHMIKAESTQTRKWAGWRGLWSIEEGIDAYRYLVCNGLGLYAAPVYEAVPAGLDYSLFQDPPTQEKENWTLSVDGTAVNAARNVIQTGEPRLTHGSEAREIRINTRDITGTLTVFEEGSTGTDWEALALATQTTRVPLVSEIDTGVAGERSIITLAEVQFMFPEATEIDGEAGWTIGYRSVPTEAQNDDVLLEFVAQP